MASELKENSLMVVKFENQKIPEFKQVRGKEWIYWGEKNNYPDYLIELYLRSSTQNAIITGKVNYVLGNGWKANKTGISLTEEALVENFIHHINPEESLDELSEKVFLDFELFNAVALEIIWNKAGTNFDIYHIPLNKLRTNEDMSLYYYSKDWESTNQSEEKTGLKVYKPFDVNEPNGSQIFIYQITAPRKGKDANVYPTPEYIGSTQAIETDVECSNYNLSEIKSGFSAGTILNFYNGVPTAEAKKEIERRIKEKFTGTDKAGSIILNFADGRDRGSEVVALSGNDLDKRYIELKKDVRQEIFTGHKVTDPNLFGVKSDGVVFERGANLISQEIFQNSYVNRRQRILEKIFNNFAKLKGIKPNLEIKPLTIISNEIFTENTIVNALPAKAVQDLVAAKLGIDLAKYENTSVVKTTQTVAQKMSSDFEEALLQAMFAVGRKKSDYEIIESFEMDFAEDDKADINVIPPTKNIPIDLPKANTMTLFSYEWRYPYTNKDIGTSRNFCKRLLEADLLYTEDEIRRMSNDFGTDVWKYKGGWFTQPNTNRHLPYCRHIWKRNVVKLK